MATTYVTYTVNSGHVSTPEFSYAAIPLLTSSTLNESDQLVVKLNGVALTLTTDYTVDAALDIVTISATIAEGDVVLIERDTDIETAIVTYVNNALLDKDNLNDSVQQLLYKLQELENETTNTIRLDISNDCWDGQGKKACNFAVAVDSTDLPNLGQVVALVAGGTPMETGQGLYDEQDGTGVKTIYEPLNFPTTDINDAKIFVTIDGITQRPTTDYSYTLVDGTPTVTFTTAPPSGTDNVQFRVMPGVVTTTYEEETLDGDVIIENTLNGNRLEDGTVDGDALVDQSVDVDKLDGGAGAANRVPVINALGATTARELTLSDIDLSAGGSAIPETFTTTSVTTGGSAPPQALGTWTWTNSTGSSVFAVIHTQTQNGSGSITLDGTLISNVGNSGSGLSYQTISFFVPAGGVIASTGTGSTRNVLGFTYQEV